MLLRGGFRVGLLAALLWAAAAVADDVAKEDVSETLMTTEHRLEDKLVQRVSLLYGFAGALAEVAKQGEGGHYVALQDAADRCFHTLNVIGSMSDTTAKLAAVEGTLQHREEWLNMLNDLQLDLEGDDLMIRHLIGL
eukprot:TRINITY_DN43359_c0_g1_i2.p2 TRINITY_DN43359_c0_g1~~TRINITY_DN43359_c0_g1_i2.p2  ORF type:complete len:137 (-),score=37.58 TRINITY_DN43359_c0_g1_i2:364-774(-)